MIENNFAKLILNGTKVLVSILVISSIGNVSYANGVNPPRVHHKPLMSKCFDVETEDIIIIHRVRIKSSYGEGPFIQGNPISEISQISFIDNKIIDKRYMETVFHFSSIDEVKEIKLKVLDYDGDFGLLGYSPNHQSVFVPFSKCMKVTFHEY